MHADRANRTGLTILGLLILAIGIGGMLTSVGVFGSAYSRNTLFGNKVSDWIGGHYWVWYIAAAVCLLVIAVALRWIIALLLSTDRAGDIPVPVASREGDPPCCGRPR